jgi:hypothetical protein
MLAEPELQAQEPLEQLVSERKAQLVLLALLDLVAVAQLEQELMRYFI